MFKRKFEEEVAPATEAPAETADPKTKLIEALTAMGLNAEQAEAVYSMAEDLISATSETTEEATAVEASRQRRGRARMSRRGGRRLSSRSRSRFSRDRRERRERFAKARRTTEGRRPRRSELSQEQKVIARQRRQIALMRDQLKSQGQAPAGRKLSANPIKGTSVAQRTIEGGSVKERVFNFVKDLI